MTTPKHSVSVAGVVIDSSGRILLVQRRDNERWEPPGGVLELGETFEQGVKREVLEETGVKVEAIQLTGIYKNMTRGIVALVYRCRAVSGLLQETSEAKRVEWKTIAEAQALMDSAYFVRVADAYESRFSVRYHDGINLISSTQSNCED